MDKVFIIIAVILISLFIKNYFDNKKYNRLLTEKCKKLWGEVPEEEYSTEKLKSIRFYYDSIKDADIDVDDITWNDLDMTQIFMTINNTNCAIGEEYLYAILRKPMTDEAVLTERNRLCEYFISHEKERIDIQRALRKMGKLTSISVFEYINRLDLIKKESNWNHVIPILAFGASVGATFYNVGLGVLLLIACIGYNVFQYFKRKAEIEKYFSVVTYIIRWLDTVKEIEKMDIPELSEYTDRLKETAKAFRRFQSGAAMVLKKQGGSIMDFLVDNVNMVLHFDLIKFNNMINDLQKNRSTLNRMFQDVGLLDSMTAVASFRCLMGDYCVPVLEKSTRPFMDVEDVYHPMLNSPVKNSIKEDRCVLLTGSNASGKSTFIKTLAINAVLAQTINTSISKSYHATYFKIMSSMALQDNLSGNESYYIVEIKSLKRILDGIMPEVPMLCFVDEVLRGTNTLERIAASSQILKTFSTHNVMCFAATHDIELTHILEKYYSNYHFQEEVVKNDVLFDYILYKGRAMSKNAIKLLGIMGYSEDIIDSATGAADHFQECGEWISI